MPGDPPRTKKSAMVSLRRPDAASLSARALSPVGIDGRAPWLVAAAMTVLGCSSSQSSGTNPGQWNPGYQYPPGQFHSTNPPAPTQQVVTPEPNPPPMPGGMRAPDMAMGPGAGAPAAAAPAAGAPPANATAENCKQ